MNAFIQYLQSRDQDSRWFCLSLYNTELHNETKVSTMLYKYRIYTVLNKYMVNNTQEMIL